MYRSREGWRPARFLAMVVIALAGLSVAVPPALAQETQQQKPRNLIEFLFGTRKPQADAPAPKKTTARPRRNRTQPVAPPEPEIEIIEKSPSARTVVVVGDFMGSGLAEGLDIVFAQNPEIRIADRSNGSSGLARDDFFNWPQEIKGVIEAEKPAAIVVMLGSNDRQQMTVGDVREQPLTQSWIREYESRSKAFATAMQAGNAPFIWVSQPSFKPKKMLSEMLVLNDIHCKAAESAGGVFVDIWDGFVDENGAFVTSGPDINGQSVRLRAGDGINLTKAGKRKVAFYTEKPLYKILGITPSGAPVLDEAVPSEAVQQRSRPVDRTQPVGLNDPELDGGAELLGQKPGVKDEPRTPADQLAIKGIAPDTATGRADDFGPPKPGFIGPELPQAMAGSSSL